MLNDLAVRKQSAEWKHSLPGSVSVGGGGGGGRSCGLRTHNNRSTTNTDDGSNGPATLPRRRGVNQHTTPIITPSPEVLSAALSREYRIKFFVKIPLIPFSPCKITPTRRAYLHLLTARSSNLHSQISFLLLDLQIFSMRGLAHYLRKVSLFTRKLRQD